MEDLGDGLSGVLSPSNHALITGAREQDGGKKRQRSYGKKKTGFEHICAPCFLRQKESYQASSEDVQA